MLMAEVVALREALDERGVQPAKRKKPKAAEPAKPQLTVVVNPDPEPQPASTDVQSQIASILADFEKQNPGPDDDGIVHIDPTDLADTSVEDLLAQVGVTPQTQPDPRPEEPTVEELLARVASQPPPAPAEFDEAAFRADFEFAVQNPVPIDWSEADMAEDDPTEPEPLDPVVLAEFEARHPDLVAEIEAFNAVAAPEPVGERLATFDEPEALSPDESVSEEERDLMASLLESISSIPVEPEPTTVGFSTLTEPLPELAVAAPVEPADEVLRRVPADLAIEALAIPLAVADGALICKVAEPIDQPALDRLGQALNLRIEAVGAPIVEVVRELKVAYARPPEPAKRRFGFRLGKR